MTLQLLESVVVLIRVFFNHQRYFVLKQGELHSTRVAKHGGFAMHSCCEAKLSFLNLPAIPMDYLHPSPLLGESLSEDSDQVIERSERSLKCVWET